MRRLAKGFARRTETHRIRLSVFRPSAFDSVGVFEQKTREPLFVMHSTMPRPCSMGTRLLSPQSRPAVRIGRMVCSACAPADVPPTVDPSAISIKSSQFSEGMYTVRGILETSTPADAAYNILLDIGNSHNVYRNISDSNVWFTEDGDKRLTEHCGWNFLMFAGTFPVILDVEEEHRDRLLEFNMVECNFMKDMKGRWEVSEKQDGGCIIDHTLSVRPVVVPPAMIGAFTKRIFAKQVKQILEDLVEELDRRGAMVVLK
ncbi:hypothetical protein BSKO_07509 [Bryopsis sp. KO-2023]|nr:hypothetical protein BSKO_07509 [Bryopsis sp. KO-2023]